MYAAQANIEARLGKALTAAQADYLNDVLGDSIDQYINDQTHTQFGSDEVTDVYVDDSPTSTIVIPTMHDITSVSYIAPDGTLSLIPDTEYYTFPRSSNNKYAIKRWYGVWLGDWAWRRDLAGTFNAYGTYKLTGKLGYDTVPADIIWVATELSMKGLTPYSGNTKREKVGDWETWYADSFDTPSEWLQTFEKYKRMSRSVL